MKTINNKKTAVIFTITLFLSFFIAPIVLAEQNDSSIWEENVEMELKVEPWMTNIEEFNKMTAQLHAQNQAYISEECTEESIPVEPWMSDLSYFNRIENNKLETIKLVTLIASTTKNSQNRLLQ